jgi:hypothetical protein
MSRGVSMSSKTSEKIHLFKYTLFDIIYLLTVIFMRKKDFYEKLKQNYLIIL